MEESPAFVEFLEFLGHKIELHDFKGFEHLFFFQQVTSCFGTSVSLCYRLEDEYLKEAIQSVLIFAAFLTL